jgi:hypothetical protein
MRFREECAWILAGVLAFTTALVSIAWHRERTAAELARRERDVNLDFLWEKARHGMQSDAERARGEALLREARERNSQ